MKSLRPENLHKDVSFIDKGKSQPSTERSDGLENTLSNKRGKLEPGTQLSSRELDVLQCLAQGQTTLQIGSTLFISENTVKTHIRHILDKLEASNRTEAVSKALQMGFIKK